jgi:hypothetical protein
MRITQNKPPRESGDGAASKEKEEVDDTTNALSVSTRYKVRPRAISE